MKQISNFGELDFILQRYPKTVKLKFSGHRVKYWLYALFANERVGTEQEEDCW